jgi:hypothetical protein
VNEERVILGAGCFWGVQELMRRREGVLSTQVAYTGGSGAYATYANHDTHAEAVEVIFDPTASVFGRFSNCFSRSTTRRRAIARVTAWVPATGRRSSTPAMSRSALPKIRLPTSMRRGYGLARS